MKKKEYFHQSNKVLKSFSHGNKKLTNSIKSTIEIFYKYLITFVSNKYSNSYEHEL